MLCLRLRKGAITNCYIHFYHVCKLCHVYVYVCMAFSSPSVCIDDLFMGY